MAKAACAADARVLTDIPNIGPALARDLRLAGVERPAQLKRRDAFNLYRQLCTVTRTRHDPCVLDTFIAAIDFMKGNPPAPWWHFTTRRKQRFPNL